MERTKSVNVRGVDREAWHRLNVYATEQQITLGAILNRIIAGFLAKKKAK